MHYSMQMLLRGLHTLRLELPAVVTLVWMCLLVRMLWEECHHIMLLYHLQWERLVKEICNLINIHNRTMLKREPYGNHLLLLLEVKAAVEEEGAHQRLNRSQKRRRWGHIISNKREKREKRERRDLKNERVGMILYPLLGVKAVILVLERSLLVAGVNHLRRVVKDDVSMKMQAHGKGMQVMTNETTQLVTTIATVRVKNVHCIMVMDQEVHSPH